jgi:hypothetical protein
LFSAIGQKRLESLDAQMQADLTAAGVAEQTDLEKAQAELDVAIKAGNKQTILDKQNALTRLQIQKDYEKKKAQVQYEAALAQWDVTLALGIAQGAQAIIGAFSTQPVWLGIAMGLMMSLLTGLQIAAIVAAKPTAPAFAFGGIVPGSSYSGDQLTARVNSGEMILNDAQQKNLWNMLNGQSGNQATSISISIPLDGEVVAKVAAKYYKNGVVTFE